ncbi:hypothetical protein CU276_13055 [Yersinia kristensenii]|nr:hypothetical protein CU276_13055 [Yersinia kristensenii]
MSEGLTAPRGTPTAYAVTTPTARFPFIWLCQQPDWGCMPPVRLRLEIAVRHIQTTTTTALRAG